jgi:hypothetical protein
MKVLVSVRTDSDAFSGTECGYELARILRLAAGKLAGLHDDDVSDVNFALRDINGNKCGFVRAIPHA